MSLIPSESASFPDLLGRGLGASRNSKWRAPFAEEVAPPANDASPATSKPAPIPPSDPPSNGTGQGIFIAPLPDQSATGDQPPVERDEVATVPAPVKRIPRLARPTQAPTVVASLPPNGSNDRIRFKPFRKSGSVERAAPPLQPAAVGSEVVRPLHFEPATAEGEPEEFGFPEALSPWLSMQRRRRARLIRFIVFEVFAIALLVGSVMTGLSHRAADDPLSVVAKILTIVSAIAVAAVPILFYGIPETLPRGRR